MLTWSACWTKPLTTYSRKACIPRTEGSGRRRCFAGLLNKAGHGLAGLSAFARPVLGTLQFERDILALLQRQIRTQLFDALAIARAAAVGHNNAKRRVVPGADAFHPNFD